MEMVKSLIVGTPILALFLCVAVGYAIGKIRIGSFQLGGIVGTLFAAIVIGQIGVPVDAQIKTMAFAMFIYSLGYVSGPQFFNSLGRSTLNQVHLVAFCTIVVFLTVWALAVIFDLDKGTAAGLMAGATTESASIGTASEALATIGLDDATLKQMRANIGVTYAVTYLFGFTLVVFFVSVVAPRMMGVDIKITAKEYEKELGDIGEILETGQEDALRKVMARVYKLELEQADGMTVADFEEKHSYDIVVQQLVRRRRERLVAPDLKLAMGDRIVLIGKLEALVEAGNFLGEESADTHGAGFVGETRDVVITNKKLIGATIQEARMLINPKKRRGVYATRLVRVGFDIEMRPNTRAQAGDIITLYGPSDMIDSAASEIGYSMDRSDAVDYVYLGLGIIVGILIGMITVPIAGAPVALHTGGGCLISGLVFGWLRSKKPTFGSLPPATALHMKDFGLAVFVASVGLEVGPRAMELLIDKGLLLPFLAAVMVLVPLISSMYYARYVLKMNPAVICGALAGLLTCTAGLNATVAAADSETPVLGYTVPYAIANVTLTLMGPVIVFVV